MVALTLCLAYVVSVLDRYIMSVVLEPMKRDLNLSDTQLGILNGISLVLVYSVASIPIGRLADISNRRNIIIIGILFWSACTIASGFMSSFEGLLAARLGVGLGEAALIPAAMSILAAYFRRDVLNRAVAVFTSGASFGRAAAFLGGGALLAIWGAQGQVLLAALPPFRPWQALFVLAGLTGFVVAALCLTIVEPPREASTKRPFADSARMFWSARSLYLRIFCTQGLVIGIAGVLATWMISLYVRKHGLPVGEASMIVGGSSLILGPLGAFGGGWLMDLLIRRQVLDAALRVLIAILIVAPISGFLFVISDSFWLTFGAYCLAYTTLVASGPAVYGGLQMITSEEHRGFISSLFLTFTTLIGIGLGPLIVGLLNDYVFLSEQAIDKSIAATLLLFGVIGLPLIQGARAPYRRAMGGPQDIAP